MSLVKVGLLRVLPILTAYSHVGAAFKFTVAKLDSCRFRRAACKFMDANGNGWLSDAIRCYDYCTNADTQIISNSWGVYESSPALQVRLCFIDAMGAALACDMPLPRIFRPLPQCILPQLRRPLS